MWEILWDVFLDVLTDSLKTLPFLFLCFTLLEFLEHRAGQKTLSKLESTKKAGPVIGAVFGVLPQCGFSVVASNLYSGSAISLGTLLAVFLSTSDEALIIMLSAPAFVPDILVILAVKIVLGIVLGYIIDLVFRHKGMPISKLQSVHEEHHHCGCACNSHSNFIKQVLKHTLSIWLFIFAISLVLGTIIELAGTKVLEQILLTDSMLQPLLAALVGLIPNCTASVLLAELYMQNVLSFASLLAGLCAATGLGLLTLFRVAANKKNCLLVLLLLYGISIAAGYLAALF